MLVCICLLLPASGAFAAGLKFTPATQTVPINKTFTVKIEVDAPVTFAEVLGAAFTITHDAGIEIVSGGVDSTFFDTFQNQFAGTAYTGPFTVDGYDQPLVTNLETVKAPAGMRIAAARVKAETDPAKTTLFTLIFKFTASAAENATYNFSIVPTKLYNTAAGYAETGENIDLLVGYDSGTDTFPVKLAHAGYTPVGGTVTVDNFILGDASGDGQITAFDALIVLNCAAGNLSDSQCPLSIIDVNCDGQKTAFDALLILNYAAGNIASFPCLQ